MRSLPLLSQLLVATLPCARGFGALANSEPARKVYPHEDSNDNCASWAEAGECEANPAYMNSECRYSCAPAELRAIVAVEAGSNASATEVTVDGSRLCPIRIEGTWRFSRRRTAATTRMTLINQQMRNLELLWYDGRSERRYWVVDARGRFEISTRAGDRWRLRMKSGELAAEISVGDSPEQRFVIPACLPPSQEAQARAAATHDVEPPTDDELQRREPTRPPSPTPPRSRSRSPSRSRSTSPSPGVTHGLT